MSVPASLLDTSWVPIAVLGASLLGSGHCIAMCGGLVMATARTPREHAFYHLGRLGGYLALGSLAGALGKELFRSELAWASWVSAVALGGALIYTGIRVGSGRPIHLSWIPQRWLVSLHRWTGGAPLPAGVLTALLPCGWLHTYVFAAVATQSVTNGAGVLLAFWVGTLPALALAPEFAQRLLRVQVSRAPRAAAVILIAAGLTNIGLKFRPALAHRAHAEAKAESALPDEPSCH